MGFFTPRRCDASCKCDPGCRCEIRIGMVPRPGSLCYVNFTAQLVRKCDGATTIIDPDDYGIWLSLESTAAGTDSQLHYEGLMTGFLPTFNDFIPRKDRLYVLTAYQIDGDFSDELCPDAIKTVATSYLEERDCDLIYCCNTHKITSFSFLSASSIDNCCGEIIGTYIPDSGLSGGCEYIFYEEYPEPDDPCTIEVTDPDDPDPPPPPAASCYENVFAGTTYRFFLRSIRIEGVLDSGDLVGDTQWGVTVELSFWAYAATGGPGTCIMRRSYQLGGFLDTTDVTDSCASGTGQLLIVSNFSETGEALFIHPTCGLDAPIDMQVNIEPL
jgi:hypothetical protein